MIKRIELKNIQSHESTSFNLCSGINCIIGSSNNGKSAILRGLYWARTNRPLGIDTLASHWALDKKGNLNAEMSVEIENDNGTVIRRRTADKNQYVVNGNVLNVVKSDVPAEVTDILRLSDTNIQKQLDEPFLLSNTTGEVAKYFNHIARLDVIDTALTNAESMRRQNKKYVETTEAGISVLEKREKSLSWIDGVKSLLAEYKKFEDSVVSIAGEADKVERQLDEADRKSLVIKKYASAIKARELADSASDIYGQIKDLKTEADVITGEAGEFADSMDFIEKVALFSSAKKQILKMGSLQKMIDADMAEVSLLKIAVVEDKIGRVAELEGQIKNLNARLPNICPLCGQLIKAFHMHAR